MTFDDGPTIAPAKPYSSQGITGLILDAMKEYGARGTFDVIGSTAENYPDKVGRPGSFTWGGVRFDHYPEFGEDRLAGAVNQPDLVKRIIEEGHEVSNHGYRHLAFGKQKIIYGLRAYFRTLEKVTEDLLRLHNFILENFQYVIKLGRPPHYIDYIPDGHSSFDAYEVLGYQYLGASFDGGGWRKPSDDPRKEVEKMVSSLKAALEKNPDCLCGQIIFEKDGYNMSSQAPVVEALPEKLALLKRYGYMVIPVGELMSMSPYKDIGPHHQAFSAVRYLEEKGLPVLYRDNTFRADQFCRISEMSCWLSVSQKAVGGRSGEVVADSERQDEPLTFGLLFKMVPQAAVLASGIDIKDKSRPVPRWIAAMVACETLKLERESREGFIQ